jgi:replicative DNA helicase
MDQPKKPCEIFLRAYLEWENFRSLFIDNWKSEYFDEEAERNIYKIFQHRWVKKQEVTQRKEIETLILSTRKTSDDLRKRLFDKVNNIFDINMLDYSESYVKELFLDVLRRRSLNFVIKGIIDKVNKSGTLDEEEIKSELLSALDIQNNEDNVGVHVYKDDVIQRMLRLQEAEKTQFKTGFSPDLDKILKMKRKKLIAVSAQLNVGKSMFMNNLAVNFARDGFNVLYLSLEMDQDDIAKRWDMMTFGYESDDYFQRPDDVVAKMEEYKKKHTKLGNLIVKSYPPRSLATFQIKSLLERIRLKHNYIIDVIFIDYLTIMRPNQIEKETTMFDKGKDIAEELRALAGEENCLVFTALQVKGAAYGHHHQGSEMVAESLAIPQTLDFLINMIEIIKDETDQKYFMLSHEKVRDGKKTKKKVFLKLLDNLKITGVDEKEQLGLEEDLKTMENSKYSARKAKSVMGHIAKESLADVKEFGTSDSSDPESLDEKE